MILPAWFCSVSQLVVTRYGTRLSSCRLYSSVSVHVSSASIFRSRARIVHVLTQLQVVLEVQNWYRERLSNSEKLWRSIGWTLDCGDHHVTTER